MEPGQAEEAPASAVFIPQSINKESLVTGISYTYFTPVPKLIRKTNVVNTLSSDDAQGTPCALGVDEAGRGPVIGPMIYGAFYLPLEKQHDLLSTKYKFDDSKVLTPGVRARLMKSVCTSGTDLYDTCGWAIQSISARDIGSGMLKNGGPYNLNAQAMDATIEIIRGIIDQGINVREIYIDTIGTPTVYQKKLERVFPSIHIRVEKKADSLFPCVSAASVVAKVTRDVSCELLYENQIRLHGRTGLAEDGAGWGSGYPSDARCSSWLKSEMHSLFGWGSECRFSWATAKDLLDLKTDRAFKVDWPIEQDTEPSLVSEYFSISGPTATQKRGKYQQLQTWFGTQVPHGAF